MKRLIVALVIAIVAFAGVGVAAAPLSNTATAMRLAATGTGESVIMAGPSGLYLLAAKFGDSIVFACMNGDCKSAAEFFNLARSGNTVSISTWGQLVRGLQVNGWMYIPPSQLPQNIIDAIAKPTIEEYLKTIIQTVSAALGGGGTIAFGRKREGG